MNTNSSTSHEAPLIHLGAFLQSLLPPLIVWTTAVGLVSLAGQPGIVCVTPMAWLLATWSGNRYTQITSQQTSRHPLVGPALSGALLGAYEGILFSLVTTLGMPVSTPEDATKSLGLSIFMIVVGALVCAGLSSFTATLALRRNRQKE